MAFPVVPVAIGAAGVAAILGYLFFFGGKKPGRRACRSSICRRA